MLERARARTDIEWVLADAASAPFDREFELVVMSGHAFQVFVEDDQLRQSLQAIARALVGGGRFAFETRHPQARAWEKWNTSFETRNPGDDVVTVTYELKDVTNDVVRLTEALSGQWWTHPQIEHGALRFLGADALAIYLREAGFVIEQQFGDWDRTLVTNTSEEIIVIARRE